AGASRHSSSGCLDDQADTAAAGIGDGRQRAVRAAGDRVYAADGIVLLLPLDDGVPEPLERRDEGRIETSDLELDLVGKVLLVEARRGHRLLERLAADEDAQENLEVRRGDRRAAGSPPDEGVLA